MKREWLNLAMNQIISEKRKALGLTQEQVAEHLGVTTPVVNKWERGVTCPDLALLPALARLLKTDPNTLLSFEESLTKQEIVQILNEGTEISMKEGFVPAFSWMMDKTRAYPNCTELLHPETKRKTRYPNEARLICDGLFGLLLTVKHLRSDFVGVLPVT